MPAVHDWLDDVRTSYDAVAESYADQLRDGLHQQPHLRAALAVFAELALATGGPVLDAGCGPGGVTAHLRDLGLDMSGIDLSPGMVEVARREHPGVRFAVGSMTDLDLADASLAGVLSCWSLVNVPDDAVVTALGEFHRVLRPGGHLLVGFHGGTGSHAKTSGYGGHPMRVHVHRRSPERVEAWLRAAGFAVAARTLLDPGAEVPAVLLFAHRP